MHQLRLTGLLFLILLSGSSRGQEMLGTTLGNYAGINNVQLNPSGMIGSKQWLDIQLIGLDVSIQNNYLYLAKDEFVLWDVFKPGFVLPSHDEDYGTEVRNFYRYDNTNRKNALIQLRVNGPGAMLLWDKHAFGIHSGARSVTSMRKLPVDLANFMYLGLNYKPQQNILFQHDKRFSMTQMSWFEVGLAYATEVYGRGYNRIDAGISVRKLFGLAGMYVVVDDLDYMVLDDSTMMIENLNARYGFSLPLNYTSNDIGVQIDPLTAGGGWGLDLGVTYTRLKKVHQTRYFDRLCEQPYEDYLYRIGVSLIDIGAITFKNRAQTYQIENQSALWENLTHFDFQTIDQLMDTISYQFYGDPNTAYQNDRFTMWLPSALGVTFDYHYRNNWYANAALVLPFRMSPISVTRSALLAITPRYESYWFEANMPISVYDWSQLRLGLSLRFYVLTIGTEKLGPFLGLSNFNGMDLYISLKLPLDKGRCGRGGKKQFCPAYDQPRAYKY
jgi:hypothetical protein